jgi:hypothetical protein
MRIIVLLSLLFWSAVACSGGAGAASSSHPFYLGLNGGYGATTWKGLVPNVENQLIALNLSTPTSVQEGGGVFGGVIGFELGSSFAIEGNFLAYPDATVFFDEDSLFAFENDGHTELHTQTKTISLMAKIMLTVPRVEALRVYSSLGVGGIHRRDEINDVWLATPSFGAGFNYVFTEHIMGELVGNYMAGYGESELNPAKDFVPFLYAFYARIAYRV